MSTIYRLQHARETDHHQQLSVIYSTENIYKHALRNLNSVS